MIDRSLFSIGWNIWGVITNRYIFAFSGASLKKETYRWRDTRMHFDRRTDVMPTREETRDTGVIITSVERISSRGATTVTANFTVNRAAFLLQLAGGLSSRFRTHVWTHVRCALPGTIYDSFHGSLAKTAGRASPSVPEGRVQKNAIFSKSFPSLLRAYIVAKRGYTSRITSRKTDLHTLLAGSRFRPSNLTRWTSNMSIRTRPLIRVLACVYTRPKVVPAAAS